MRITDGPKIPLPPWRIRSLIGPYATSGLCKCQQKKYFVRFL